MLAAKPILAGTLLMGVAAIWVPRLTGTEVPWLPSEDLPSYNEVPTSGDTDPGPSSTDASSDGSTQDEISMQALQDVVDFLDQRNGLGATQAPGPETSASVTVTDPDPPQVTTEVEPLFGPPRDPEPEGPTWAQQVEAYFAANPLHTIVDGAGLTTATFGFQRVAVGDSLMDGLLEVAEIDGWGVRFDSEHGPIHVSLPPPGARTYSQRRTPTDASAPTEDD